MECSSSISCTPRSLSSPPHPRHTLQHTHTHIHIIALLYAHIQYSDSLTLTFLLWSRRSLGRRRQRCYRHTCQPTAQVYGSQRCRERGKFGVLSKFCAKHVHFLQTDQSDSRKFSADSTPVGSIYAPPL